MTPATIVPSRSSAIEMAKCGMPCRKFDGAVERIDDPGMGLVGALAPAAFLAEEAVARAGCDELLVQDLLGALVGGGDEVRRALERDLQVLDLAEIALERARGLARGLDHDVEEGGAEHDETSISEVACIVRAKHSR